MKKARKKAPAADASVLAGIPMFSRLDAEYAREVFSRMERVSLPAGTKIFGEGESGEELYVVVSGRVAISVTPKGGEAFLLSEIGAGGVFGEMSIIDHSPRSADCRTTEETILLSLSSSDFDSLLDEYPRAAVLILDSMLEITAGRLLKTGSFLSEMVRWGDAARARAVTDPATGLFNRRYMEESFDDILSKARLQGKRLSIVMFDMDHFGSLNTRYGMAVGDRVILEGSKAFRRVFAASDILIRYGGDEFVFLLTDASPEMAQERCDALCEEFRGIRLDEHPDLRLSCSMGFASFPDHANTLDLLKSEADRALYGAKEAGRGRALSAGAVAKQPC